MFFFPLMSKTVIYFHVYILLDFSIIYRNASVLCQSECSCLHKTVNMVIFFDKSNGNDTKRESTHANVQSCPYNEKRGFVPLCSRGNNCICSTSKAGIDTANDVHNVVPARIVTKIAELHIVMITIISGDEKHRLNLYRTRYKQSSN